MKTARSSLLLKSTLALTMAMPLLASAESELVTGAATTAGADARLNFQVVIPAFISLRVGTAGTGNVDTVNFNLTQAQAETGGAIAAAPVQVALLSNVGDVRLSAAGADLTGGGNTIPLTAITVASNNTGLPHPAFGSNTTVTANAGRVINRTAEWTYTYTHDAATVGEGTYTTQVTYTAARP